MVHRTILSERQRASLFNLPTDHDTLLRFYTLSDDDLDHIAQRRKPENKLGFALQLCALRYPGRLLTPGELIPLEVLTYLAPQVGIKAADLAGYAERRQTRVEHIDAIRQLYDFKKFSGRGAAELKRWLLAQALTARSTLELAQRFVLRCRETQTILPGHSTMERLCARALVDAERETETTIATRVDDGLQSRLDKLGLLNVLLAEGLNLGLSKMAEATNTHTYGQLRRIMTWHVVETTVNRALAMVVEAQRALPMAGAWGLGNTASSDGQFFPTTRQGEAMNLINAKYGNEPGLKAYTPVSDQFAPFATQTIPSTVSEAPYILDGLLMNETGLRIKEQYADTGGFTDHVFAVTALLGFLFIPRIRDLAEKRLYLFDDMAVPKELKGLVGHKVRSRVITDNWPDLLRVVVTLADGEMPPSQLLRKLASYPRQHELAVALREVGKIERTLFITRWLVDSDMQRRAQMGLNKGEAHHALKNAIRIGRQGEIRDRTSDGQRYRIASLNLLAAIIIYWNTKHLGLAVEKRRRKGIIDSENILSHVSPLGWAHILLTGE